MNKYAEKEKEMLERMRKFRLAPELRQPATVILGYGPGTELASLIHELAGDWITACGGCKALAVQMDRWGDECSNRIDEIETRMVENIKEKPRMERAMAKLAGLVNSDWTPRALIEEAIRRAKAAIHLHTSSMGIGDSVCVLYAACGLADTGRRVVFHSRNRRWTDRASHPNLFVCDHEPIGIDVGGGLPFYGPRIHHAESFVKDYCRRISGVLGIPEFSGSRPQTIRPASPATHILLAPFSCYASREWPSDRWKELALILCGSGKPCMAIGQQSHEQRLKGMFDGTGATIHFNQSPEWVCETIASSACVVGNDSGIAHVGGLLGAKTVCVHAGCLPHSFLFNMAPSVTSVTAGDVPRGDNNLAVLRTITVDRVIGRVAPDRRGF